MSQLNCLKIDVFCHILPPKYKEAVYRVTPDGSFQRRALERLECLTTLSDLGERFRIMDKYEGLMQFLTTTSPPLEEITDSQKTPDLARLANDEMAELVLKYPDRFVGAAACLPMNNIDAALKEIDRAIVDLRLRGIQLYTPTNDKPLDSPEFMAIYDKMAKYNLPIFIHPKRTVRYPDYKGESESMYHTFLIFGWPYETTIAMTRIVFSGILEKYPNLKFITHHCGAMVPFLADRIIGCYDIEDTLRKKDYQKNLAKPPIHYFKMFYNDTAIYGNTPGLMCGYAFCGADHLLFATDFPHDAQMGDRYNRQTINAVEQMTIPDSEKVKIFEDNARQLLRLPI